MEQSSQPSPEVSRPPASDEEVRESLEAEGWQYAGREYVSANPLNPESGRFEEIRHTSDEDLRTKYIGQYGRHGFDEVRIEQTHEMQSGRPRTGALDIYLRRQQDRAKSE